jgi:hypothetical protein
MKFHDELGSKAWHGFGCCCDGSNAGVQAGGSEGYEGRRSLPRSSERDADVPHVQVLHRIGRQERWHVYGYDGCWSLPTSPRQD